ncbi:MAG: NYN domain-containing protein [Candidatus Dormibacteria bacterium]
MSRLVVDGYNILHAWPDLARSMRTESLEDARRRLVVRLAEYRASTGNEVLVVFDARRRTLGSPDQEVVEGVEVRYGSSRESADHVIERLMYEASRRGTVLEMVLATDDHLQRDLVRAMGVPTMSSRALLAEVERAEGERTGEIRRRDQGLVADDRLESRIDPEVRRQLEAIRRGDLDSGEGAGEGPGGPPPPPARKHRPPQGPPTRWRRLR